MPDMLDREKVLKLLKQRRNFLYKVYKQNKNSIAAAHHLEALETTEEIYEMIADMPYDCTTQVGEWELACEGTEENRYWCSCCKGKGGTFGGPTPPPFEFCPHCGAKMV